MPAIDRGLDSLSFLSDALRDALRRRLRELGGVALIAVSILLALALATWSVQDPSLSHATKCTLISFDSTIRSNMSVGLPIDFAAYREDSFELRIERIAENDDYFNSLRQAWGNGLRSLFDELP